MKEYSVRYAALESLPNFNEAFRFAKEFEGKVFVIEYGAQTWAETCVNYDKVDENRRKCGGFRWEGHLVGNTDRGCDESRPRCRAPERLSQRHRLKEAR